MIRRVVCLRFRYVGFGGHSVQHIFTTQPDLVRYPFKALSALLDHFFLYDIELTWKISLVRYIERACFHEPEYMILLKQPGMLIGTRFHNNLHSEQTGEKPRYTRYVSVPQGCDCLAIDKRVSRLEVPNSNSPLFIVLSLRYCYKSRIQGLQSFPSIAL